MEILIADTAMQIKSRYILTFVDVASPYYHDYIEKHTTFSDGLCYTGYLWDCFRNKVPMSEDECIRFIKRQKTIYCFWDIHSKDRILIPDYWKYPKAEKILPFYGRCLQNWLNICIIIFEVQNIHGENNGS